MVETATLFNGGKLMFKQKIEEAMAAYNDLIKEKRSLLDGAEKESEASKIKEARSKVEALNKKIDEAKTTLEDYKALAAEKRNKIPPIDFGKIDEDPAEDTKTVETRMLNDYLHKRITRDALSDGLKSSDATVTIPKDIQYVPTEEVNTVTDLSKLVQHFNATTASGTYPIVKRATAVMHTVAELEKNPALAKPEFINVAWKVDTYRAAIPLSQESIDDSAADLIGIVSNNAMEQKINTTNSVISALLKTFTAKAVTGDNIDAIKEIINVNLDPAYAKTIIASQSFYQYLDTLKDKNGRYLLSEPITSGSPAMLLGIPVIKVKDELLGKAGEAHAFIGDINRAVLYADRTDIQVRWVDSEIYGQYLQVGLRFGAVVADAKAGYFVTASPSSTTTSTGH